MVGITSGGPRPFAGTGSLLPVPANNEHVSSVHLYTFARLGPAPFSVSLHKRTDMLLSIDVG